MEHSQIAKILFKDCLTKIINHKGLVQFAKQRAKFEGWLKVEVCDTL